MNNLKTVRSKHVMRDIYEQNRSVLFSTPCNSIFYFLGVFVFLNCFCLLILALFSSTKKLLVVWFYFNRVISFGFVDW